MRYPLRLCLVIFCLMPLLAFAAASGPEPRDEAALQKQLARISRQISRLRKELNTASAEEKKLLDELQRQDKRINAQHQRIRSVQGRIDEVQKKIAEVNGQIAQKSKQIGTQKKELATLLKLAVYTRHDLGLKRLLLASGSQRSDLAGHQIRYLQHRLYELVREIATDIGQLETLQNQLQARQQQWQLEQEQLVSEQDTLQQQRHQREFVLQALRKKIRADKNEMQQLGKNRQRLNRLLKELSNLLDDLPDDLGKNTRFARLKGRLEPPVSGRVLHRFGSVRGRQRQRWEGLVFAANRGQPVSSVAYGRVAFADWLRGYGLLVVLDHGDGYMSLYGHNEALLVEPGDWVQAGEDIALAGNSGSLSQPAVYFELRHDAKPVNPSRWLKRP